MFSLTILKVRRHYCNTKEPADVCKKALYDNEAQAKNFELFPSHYNNSSFLDKALWFLQRIQLTICIKIDPFDVFVSRIFWTILRIRIANTHIFRNKNKCVHYLSYNI